MPTQITQRMRSVMSLGIAVLLLGFAQDFLSFPVSVRSEDETPDRNSRYRRDVCQNLCSSKRNELFGKEISFDQCLRDCSLRERAGDILSSSVEIKEELNSPMLRSRRSTYKYGKDCNINNKNEPHGYVVRNKNIRVDFEGRKPNLTIEWNRMYNEDYNWTSYALYYHNLKTDQTTCIVVPKDQYKDHHKNTLEWIMRDGEGNWRYPEPILLAIITYPGYYPKLSLDKFGPRPPEPPTAPPTRGSSDTKIIAAVSGLATGIVLLLVLVVVYRKRVNVCSNFSRGQRDGLENPRFNNTCYVDEDAANGNLLPVIKNNLQLSGPEIFYACYYPENDDFQNLVASVVNFFRRNGYMVVMDVMSCSEMVNLGPTRWAEQQIKKARNILVFLSPGLLRLCGAEDDLTQYSISQERQRVWYELSLLRTIYSQSHSAARMVCITLPSKTAINSQDLPLWAELRYRWPEDKRKILNRLNDRPIIQPL